MDNKNFDIDQMPDGHKLNKSVLLISGILFTVVGFYFFDSKDSAVYAVVLWVGFSKIISGISCIVTSFNSTKDVKNWQLITGIIDLIFGVILINFKVFRTAIALIAPFIIATWALCRGAIGIVGSIRLRKADKYWVLPFVSGIVAVLAAIIMLTVPYISLFSIINVICVFLIFMGVLLILQYVVLLFTSKNNE